MVWFGRSYKIDCPCFEKVPEVAYFLFSKQLPLCQHFLNEFPFNSKGIEEFVIQGITSLQTLIFTSNSFQYLKKFSVMQCEHVIGIMIGSNCCIENNGSFSVIQLENLTNLVIGENSFKNYSCFEMKSIGIGLMKNRSSQVIISSSG